jgi:hypothetical protein
VGAGPGQFAGGGFDFSLWQLLSRLHHQRRHRRCNTTRRPDPLYGGVAPSLSIGPDAEYQAENTGVFQNRIMPSGTAIWSKGRHSLSFGGSWSYTQLNLRDRRTGTGSVASPDYVSFLDNWVTPYSTQNFTASTYLQGNANRYYRANETGLFAQDKFQVTPPSASRPAFATTGMAA